MQVENDKFDKYGMPLSILDTISEEFGVDVPRKSNQSRVPYGSEVLFSENRVLRDRVTELEQENTVLKRKIKLLELRQKRYDSH